MTFWSDHHVIIYGVRTIRVYELIQDLPYPHFMFSFTNKKVTDV